MTIERFIVGALVLVTASAATAQSLPEMRITPAEIRREVAEDTSSGKRVFGARRRQSFRPNGDRPRHRRNFRVRSNRHAVFRTGERSKITGEKMIFASRRQLRTRAQLDPTRAGSCVTVLFPWRRAPRIPRRSPDLDRFTVPTAPKRSAIRLFAATVLR
jgi:hypothetical protein